MQVTTLRSDSPFVHVVAAVIRNAAGDVLLAQRHIDAHLGGLWEFPGGKLEPGEDRFHGLARELKEELDIELAEALPLIQVPFEYPEKRVLLDVWEVRRFGGNPVGAEGQPLAWVAPHDLPQWSMPAADRPIVTALRIPDRYLITPDPGSGEDAFLATLESLLSSGIRMVQLRAKSLDDDRYAALARSVSTRCRKWNALLLLNHSPEMVRKIGADGIHLTSDRLKTLRERPLGESFLVAGSCHNHEELAHASALGLDFAVLGPVHATASHPETEPLRWQSFGELVADAALPVYALGGMSPRDIATSRLAGGQGIAAIRSLWS